MWHTPPPLLGIRCGRPPLLRQLPRISPRQYPALLVAPVSLRQGKMQSPSVHSHLLFAALFEHRGGHYHAHAFMASVMLLLVFCGDTVHGDGRVDVRLRWVFPSQVCDAWKQCPRGPRYTPPSFPTTLGASCSFPTAVDRKPRDPWAQESDGAPSKMGRGHYQREPAVRFAAVPQHPLGWSPAFPAGRCKGIRAGKRDLREACGRDDNEGVQVGEASEKGRRPIEANSFEW